MGGGLIFEYAISLEYKPPTPKKKGLRDRYVHFQSSCLHKKLQKHSTQNSWYRHGSRALFVDITFTKLRGLPTSEKSCQFNARSITFTTTCKNSNTVGHVPREISRVCWYFLHKSGSEMTCIVNGDRRRSEVMGKDSWFRVCTSSKGNKNTLRYW